MNSHREQGAAFVEFALVLPLLLLLVFGITELGRALYQLNTLTRATDAGVRHLSRSWAVLDADCQPGANWASATQATSSFVVFGNHSQSGQPLLPGMTVADVSISASSELVSGLNEAACVIRIDTRATFNAVLGDQVVPFTNLGPITLGAGKEGRYLGQ